MINIMAFRTIEYKILDATDKKCATSVQVINNVYNITQIPNSQTVTPATPPVQQPINPPIIIPGEEEEND